MTGYVLKLIAILLMVMDHVGFIFLDPGPLYNISRGFGRLVFPIFAFLIAEGCYHTGNHKKYLCRLLVFAFISEPVYDKAFSNLWMDHSYQNIFFTLFLGAAACFLYSGSRNSSYKNLSYILPFLMCVTAEVIRADYGGLGVALIFFLFVARGNFLWQAASIILVNLALSLKYSPLQLLAIFSAIPLYFYNGERGRNIKYFFYTFYLAHLAVLSVIRSLMAGAGWG